MPMHEIVSKLRVCTNACSLYISNGAICFAVLYSSFGAYGQSKLPSILHANELAKQFKEAKVNVTANSLHPGATATNLSRHNFILDGNCFTWTKGAATTCYVALHPQVNGISGEYFSNCNLTKANAQAMNVELAKKLWDFSMDLVK
ncbi:hypothetical protein Ddye_013767 [Dipteronia dyeriana]|uniref:Short-chain dehydrogenase TIC 32, chloroplastic n=1 Tax=Dipteronia dyeriana TaxID=168575 RepID=A0AAD9X6Q6_9ROSI|nr:hypothetical protein Ddye_013767 [Dipteronia dyeriana]